MTPISSQIWDMKYRLKAGDGTVVDKTVEDSWHRVARALAEPEKDPGPWREEFYSALEGFKFLPAGRILAGAGTDRQVTLFNCFVMGRVPDDMAGIFDHLKEAALTMQQGGGIGYDFSTLRPKGAPVLGVGADASGPLTFMDVWDSMCRTIMSAGFRRGAMMGTLRCDHPDIETFIEAKKDPGRLRMFNLSVLVSDDFMAAVKADRAWDLSFGGVCYKTVSARELWDHIMRSTYSYAEPGVIFIDRINKTNNLGYCEEIFATNPCGEQPLPPYGACLLGSINLASLVRAPFEEHAVLDIEMLKRLVTTAIRMLDNTISISGFPLQAQKREAEEKRRIGLGVTGLADALIMCRLRYGSEQANTLAASWLAALRDAAYRASTDLAKEKGPFPLFEAEPYLAGQSIRRLPEDIRANIARHGIRNALLTSIAPTGTISLLAGNISSGIEPVFSHFYRRNLLMPDGSRKTETVSDYAYRLFREQKGEQTPLPDYFVDAQQLRPSDHLVIQAVAQKYIDSSISKTINCPEELGFDEFKDIYTEAFELGCKGCTTYRPNPVTGAVMETTAQGAADTEVREVQEELPLTQPAAKPQDAYEAGGVVYMTQPLERPESLPGSTYKIRWPENDHAIYITINDVMRDHRRQPFEIFINSKNTEHYAWTVALTRMISAVFRRGGDISFVVEELKAVFDPRGGQWMDGRYVPSILAAIGEVIEHHLALIGFAPAQAPNTDPKLTGEATPPRDRLRSCPRCSQFGVIQQEGCDVCTTCGYSKCA